MKNQLKIIVLIPCYNCDGHISYVIENLTEDAIEKASEILVIDNGSTDNTVKNAIAAARNKNTDKIKVLINDSNYGLGGTHKLAIEYAKNKGYDYLAVLHGDGQANPKELDDFISVIDNNPRADAVLGCRFMDKSRLIGYSKIRTYGNIFFNFLYSILTGRKVYDLGSGLNIFRMEPISLIDLKLLSNGCDFNIYLLLAMFEKNMSIEHIPISWSESGQRSNVNALGIGFNALGIIFRWRLSRIGQGRFKKFTTYKKRPYKKVDV